MERILIWGAGELGGRVARSCCEAGRTVLAYTRTERRHARLRDSGAEPRLGSPCDELRPTDLLVVALPGTSAQSAAVEELRRAVRPARAVLISSTGFHAGDSGWVDELSAPGPGPRAATVAACEEAFHDLAGAAGVVLRCGGLYRAGRGPLSVLRQRGQAPLGPPDRSLALVHYDDASDATCAALEHPSPAGVYLCVTPPSPSRRQFWEEGCRVLGLPPPAFDASIGVPPVEYDVTRLRRDLLPRPAHPDWRAATRA